MGHPLEIGPKKVQEILARIPHEKLAEYEDDLKELNAYAVERLYERFPPVRDMDPEAIKSIVQFISVQVLSKMRQLGYAAIKVR